MNAAARTRKKAENFPFFPSYFCRNRACGTLYPLPLARVAPGYEAGANCAHKPGIYPQEATLEPQKGTKNFGKF